MASDFTATLTDGFELVPEHDIRNVDGAAGWIELTTPAPERAREFLGATFGWKFDPMQIGGGEYWVIQVRGHGIGGIRAPLPGMPSTAQWGTYITVEDVDRVAERAQAAGGTVLVAPTELPGVGRLVEVKHPDGGRIQAFEYLTPFD